MNSTTGVEVALIWTGASEGWLGLYLQALVLNLTRTNAFSTNYHLTVSFGQATPLLDCILALYQMGMCAVCSDLRFFLKETKQCKLEH